LQNYATALIKKQWGDNINKFSGMSLPGGVQFNGDKIQNDAEADIRRLEADMASIQLPIMDMIG
jgi:hypothetical protein